MESTLYAFHKVISMFKIVTGAYVGVQCLRQHTNSQYSSKMEASFEAGNVMISKVYESENLFLQN